MDSSDFFTWVIVPLLIILARIADQTIGTLRLVYLSKGYKVLAPVMGFFEVLIWIVAVSQIFQQLNNYFYYLAYAIGFALGNYLGLRIEEKISLGKVVIRVFPKGNVDNIIEVLKEKGYGLTIMDAYGTRGPVKILFSILNRKSLPDFLSIIKSYDDKAFYTIEDVRSSAKGVFPSSDHKRNRTFGVMKSK
jgi:uncharacterized protein YebE (UPF0316 family)